VSSCPQAAMLFFHRCSPPESDLERPDVTKWLQGMGLHSSTFQLNLSALCWIGGAHRGCVARVKRLIGGV